MSISSKRCPLMRPRAPDLPLGPVLAFVFVASLFRNCERARLPVGTRSTA
jgi:hypothetical protein